MFEADHGPQIRSPLRLPILRLFRHLICVLPPHRHPFLLYQTLCYSLPPYQIPLSQFANESLNLRVAVSLLRTKLCTYTSSGVTPGKCTPSVTVYFEQGDPLRIHCGTSNCQRLQGNSSDDISLVAGPLGRRERREARLQERHVKIESSERVAGVSDFIRLFSALFYQTNILALCMY
jgi:hypothetical protein